MSPLPHLEDENGAMCPLGDAIGDELSRLRALLESYPASSVSRALRVRAASYAYALSRCPRSEAGDAQRRALCDLVFDLRFAVDALRKGEAQTAFRCESRNDH